MAELYEVTSKKVNRKHKHFIQTFSFPMEFVPVWKKFFELIEDRKILIDNSEQYEKDGKLNLHKAASAIFRQLITDKVAETMAREQ